MREISCIIVDDEPLALSLIEGYVLKTPFLMLKGKCFNAIEALTLAGTENIDLFFLDIQMPELNGIEFSRLLPEKSKIIFTTAFSNYAIEGFRVNALDYLLKPFNYEEFLTAAIKARNWFDLKENQRNPESGDNSDFIFVKSEYKQIKINLNDVLYFEGLKDYIKIWILNQEKPVLTLMSLKSLEEKLPSGKFMRVHRSYIIALDKIQSIERGQVIINNLRITVAEQYKNPFHQFISGKSVS